MRKHSQNLFPDFKSNGSDRGDHLKVLAIPRNQGGSDPAAAERDQDIVDQGETLGFERRMFSDDLLAHDSGLLPISIEGIHHSVDPLERFVESLNPFQRQVVDATEKKFLNHHAAEKGKRDSMVVFGFVTNGKVTILQTFYVDVGIENISTWHRSLPRRRNRHSLSRPWLPLLEE